MINQPEPEYGIVRILINHSVNCLSIEGKKSDADLRAYKVALHYENKALQDLWAARRKQRCQS